MCACACVCIPPKKLGEFMFLQYVFMSPSITFACSKASRFSLQITYIAACCITWHTYTVTGLTWHTRLHDSHDTHMTYIHGYMTHWHAYTFTLKWRGIYTRHDTECFDTPWHTHTMYCYMTWHTHIHTYIHEPLNCITYVLLHEIYGVLLRETNDRMLDDTHIRHVVTWHNLYT